MDRCVARPRAQFGDRVMTAMTGNSSLVPSLIFHEAIARICGGDGSQVKPHEFVIVLKSSPSPIRHAPSSSGLARALRDLIQSLRLVRRDFMTKLTDA
jgi:hypothetical protein